MASTVESCCITTSRRVARSLLAHEQPRGFEEWLRECSRIDSELGEDDICGPRSAWLLMQDPWGSVNLTLPFGVASPCGTKKTSLPRCIGSVYEVGFVGFAGGRRGPLIRGRSRLRRERDGWVMFEEISSKY